MIVPLNRAAARSLITRLATVRAGDIVQDITPGQHPFVQRSDPPDLLAKVVVDRSLLGCCLPDGRIRLIGRLSVFLAPDCEVVVELLDVSEEEARLLLLDRDCLILRVESKHQEKGESRQ